jgi:D-alanine-D-alanine ligase
LTLVSGWLFSFPEASSRDNSRLNPESPKKIRVGLLYGGRSGEHEISVRSARSVQAALDPAKYELAEYFIDKEGKWHPNALVPEPRSNSGIDVVFPVLHGTFGEDGTVQGLLELAELPYVGAGVLASALAMDKVMTKRVCREAGLPVVDYVVLTSGAFEPTLMGFTFGFPMFVKPANLGSSVGISKAKNAADLQQALHTAAQYDRKIIIERGVTGREFECAVLGGQPPSAAMPCEIKPSQEFYTYEDKYLLDAARIDLPPDLTDAQIAEIQRLAVACFETVGCDGMARVDFLMEDSTGAIFINEINTIPGFTSISMYPKMWEYSGIPYADLLDRLIQSALDRAEGRRRIRYAR